MENLLFLGVPILKHIRVFSRNNFIVTCMNSCLLHWIMYFFDKGFVVVALLFYVHGKHLRSCRDSQFI